MLGVDYLVVTNVISLKIKAVRPKCLLGHSASAVYKRPMLN